MQKKKPVTIQLKTIIISFSIKKIKRFLIKYSYEIYLQYDKMDKM